MSASSAEGSTVRSPVPAGVRAGEQARQDDQTAVGPLHETTNRGSRLGAWIAVTKPRIIELLLVATVPAMVIGADGWPGTWLVAATLIGGTLSAGGANAINNVYDRDIDRRMARTAQRPTANDTVGPTAALILGVGLGIAGFVVLSVFVNLLAAAMATFGLMFYVFFYTMLLKRRTPQAVVIGGIAGCMPVLTGWAAVGAPFSDPRPWLLFGILFWWQPPHFWALAMKYKDDYARAGLPMMPVRHGNDETTRQILLNSWLLASLVLLYIAGASAGLAFVVPALVLTAIWLLLAHRLRRSQTVSDAMRLFHFSTIFLALVYIAAAVDALV